MFRTIKVSLHFQQPLLQTAIDFNKACQFVLNYGSRYHTYNKNVLHKNTYSDVRALVPNLPSPLVQTARDLASEILKKVGFVHVTKKHLSVRFDR